MEVCVQMRFEYEIGKSATGRRLLKVLSNPFKPVWTTYELVPCARKLVYGQFYGSLLRDWLLGWWRKTCLPRILCGLLDLFIFLRIIWMIMVKILLWFKMFGIFRCEYRFCSNGLKSAYVSAKVHVKRNFHKKICVLMHICIFFFHLNANILLTITLLGTYLISLIYLSYKVTNIPKYVWKKDLKTLNFSIIRY